ncbi:hypothetical protein IJL65_04155 [bacterium]|nr:hypothetical protein [bacterium]
MFGVLKNHVNDGNKLVNGMLMHALKQYRLKDVDTTLMEINQTYAKLEKIA